MQRTLPEGWRWVTFGEVAHEVSESTRTPIEDGFERYVGLDHFEPDSLSLKRWGMIEEDNPTFTKVFRAGQLLFGRRRAYQRKAAIADFDGICSGDIIVIEALPEFLLPDLLPFIVQSDGFWDNAIHTSAGSLSPRTKWANLAAYEFPLPPLDEQRRIAEILWAVEEAIEEWMHSLDMSQTSLSSYREKKLSEPNFIREKLGKHLVRIFAGKSVVGMNIPASSSDFGVLKVSAVGENGFQPAENKVLVDFSDFVGDFCLHRNDLLITRANTTELVGRVCIVPDDYPNLMLSDKTLRLEPKPTLSVHYLLEVLRTTSVRRQIQISATGTSGSMKNISQGDIKDLLIPVPEIGIQERLIGEMEALYTLIGKISQHIEQLQRLKKSVVHSVLVPVEVTNVQ